MFKRVDFADGMQMTSLINKARLRQPRPPSDVFIMFCEPAESQKTQSLLKTQAQDNSFIFLPWSGALRACL